MTNAAVQTAAAAAPAASILRWPLERPARKVRICFRICERLSGIDYLLELEVLDLLVRLHNLVPYLHDQLEGKIGFLHRDHGGIDVAALAGDKV